MVRCKFLSVAYVLQNESDPEISLEHKNFDLTWAQSDVDTFQHNFIIRWFPNGCSNILKAEFCEYFAEGFIILSRACFTHPYIKSFFRFVVTFTASSMI